MLRVPTDHEQRVRADPSIDDGTFYAIQVVDLKIPACKKIRRACVRHLADLKRAGAPDFPYYYDLEAAKRPVDFAKHLKHWQGDFAGKLFKPMLWQCFILHNAFGWKRADNQRRRFRYCYIEIPRKNGKSFLASVVSLYMLIADGEEGAEIYAAATKRDQAKIVWGAAIQIARKSGLMGSYVSEHWLSLQMKRTASKFEPLASDSEKLDGLNPHCAICDELHEWSDRQLWDVIEDAFGARSQPLMFVITTAGHNRNGICFEQRAHGESILAAAESRTYCDDTYFVFIADVDEEDRKSRWDKEEVWFKANPCLGEAKSLEYMRDQCNKAKLVPGKLNAFLNKQLDIWTEAAEIWLKMDRYDECAGKIDLNLLHRKPCFTGLDLSSTTDLTASVDVFPPGPYPEWTIVPYFYLPQDNLPHRERRDKVPYALWVRQGLITLTPGDIIDLEFVKRDLLERKTKFNIKECGFDPWKAVEISTSLQQQGMEMIQMRQGHATLGAPTTFLETLILKKQIRHGGNPVLRWMAANTTVIRDSNDNIRPDKNPGEGYHTRIDGVVAAIMGLGLAIRNIGPNSSPYEKRGLRVIGRRA